MLGNKESERVGQSTEGRKVFRRWKLGGFEYRSDIIAHDYMRRWLLKTPWFMLRVHHILRGDKDGEFHDHPMSFLSVILKGGYTEHTPVRGLVPKLQNFIDQCKGGISFAQFYGPGSVIFRRGEDLHWLELPPGKTAWTFLITSPFYRRWGFQTISGWIPANEYDEWKRKKAAQESAERIIR